MKHIGPYRVKQDNNYPYWTICDHSGPYKTIVFPIDHAGPYGTIQNPTGPNKYKMDHMAPHFTLTKTNMVSEPYKAMQDCIRLHGTIRVHKGSYGTIQVHTRPYGTIWDHTGP